MLNETQFMGRDGFWWWHGVCEDRQDPDKLGRIKVRILGSHTKDKSYIKSEDLQWAYVIQPLTSAAMNGIGTTPLGPVPGTWVFGFYRDGQDMQEPCVFGTIGGIPSNPPNNQEGFNDPRDYETPEKLATAPRRIASRSYPFDGSGAHLVNGTKGPQYPQSDFINEPDTHRIARNEKINLTILAIISSMIDTNVPIAFTGNWTEPNIWYNGIYPYVHVQESESGSVKVLDNTPNVEGQLDFDRTGTFEEILTNGTLIRKIVMDGYTIVLRDNYVHVMNNHHERIDKECNLSIGGRWNIEVFGNINLLCHKNVYAQINGDLDTTVQGAAKIKVGGEADIKVGGAAKIAASSMNISVAGTFDITCGGHFAVEASTVHFNSQVAVPNPPSDPTAPKQ